MSQNLPKPIRLRLGDTVEGAALIPYVHRKAIEHRRVKGGDAYTIKTRADRAHAIAILYYIEACPAFFGDDADLVERSACKRTARTWRAALGFDEYEKIPVPDSAMTNAPEAWIPPPNFGDVS